MPRLATYRILKEGPAAVAVGRIAPTGRTAPKAPAIFGAFRHIFGFCAKILYSIATLIDARPAG